LSETKLIYDSGSSSCTATYDGDTVIIKQELEGKTTSQIHLYDDEFEDIVNFVNQRK